MKKPTIMILPSDRWCTYRHFMTSYQDQGRVIQIPDYQAAFREDLELKDVVAVVRALLIERGYDNIKDFETEYKNIMARQGEDNNTFSRSSNDVIAETPLDIIKRRTKSDYVFYVDWVPHSENNKQSLRFTLEVFDSFTSKCVATSSVLHKASSKILPRQLENVIRSHVKILDEQLDDHHEKIIKEGREIILTIRCWNAWENDLETEFNGEELLDCIQKWISSNTVDGAFNLSDADEIMAQFEQVRIPIFDETGKALDARGFATMLRKYLNKAPYNINCKVMQRGLGEAMIILGEK